MKRGRNSNEPGTLNPLSVSCVNGDLDEKRTATSNLLEKGLIQKLRIEWTKNKFSFFVKVLSFVKRKKV